MKKVAGTVTISLDDYHDLVYAEEKANEGNERTKRASKELAEFGGQWGYEELALFLYKPKEYIKGTKMNFSGLKKVQDRANLVLFLREQSDNPAPLP